jgi:internalin A
MEGSSTMKLTSAIALMISMWMFSGWGWGWGVTQAAEPSLGSSFEEWCLQKASLSAERRKTVSLLLEEAGTSDCELAAKNLLSRTELKIYASNQNEYYIQLLRNGIDQ